MRSSGSGTLRKDGRWAIVVTLTAASGKKTRKTVYAATQREVQEKARKLLNTTGRTARESHTVQELIDNYKIDRWPHIEVGTKRQHGPAYKWIISGFPQRDIRQIDAPAISRWMKALTREESIKTGRTIQAYRNVLSVLFNHAIEIGWREDNPAKGLSLPAGVSAKPLPRPRLTPWGYKAVLEKETDPILRDLWEFLGETGMRPEEALRLKREAIFYSMDLYWVRGGIKTAAGKGREIPVPDALAHRLLERTEWLFPAPDGTRAILYRHMLDLWDEAVIRAEIDPFTNPYQLRKLAVSRWFANGLPDDVIEMLSGHTDVKLAREVYNRIGRERLMESVFSGRYVTGMSEKDPETGPLGL